MQFKNRSSTLILSIITALVVICLSFPSPSQAFLAASGLSLIAATLLPQVLLFVLNIFLTLIAFFKKKKFITISLLMILLVSGIYLTRRYLFLKDLNASPVITNSNNETLMSEEEQWQIFKEDVANFQSDDVAHNFQDAADEHLSIVRQLEVTTYKPSDYTQIIGYTLTNFVLEGTTIDSLAGDFFIAILNYAFDQNFLEQYLAQYNITKEDKILVYDPSGITGGVVAFILNHYDYQVHSLSLSKADNLTFNNPEKYVALDNNLFVIKEVKESQLQDHQYVYFMITVNDYYYKLWSQYYCDSKALPDNWHFYRINDTLDEYAVACSENRAAKITVNQLDFPLLNKEAILNLADVRILCYNKWQCFLTKHVLYEQQLQEQFSTLYCLDCSSASGK